MSDLVKRLRWRAENTSTLEVTTPQLCAEAADEIERLMLAISTPPEEPTGIYTPRYGVIEAIIFFVSGLGMGIVYGILIWGQ